MPVAMTPDDGVLRGCQQRLNSLCALRSHHVLDLPDDLSLCGCPAKHQAGDSDYDDQQRRHRKHRVVSQSCSQPRRIDIHPAENVSLINDQTVLYLPVAEARLGGVSGSAQRRRGNRKSACRLWRMDRTNSCACFSKPYVIGIERGARHQHGVISVGGYVLNFLIDRDINRVGFALRIGRPPSRADRLHCAMRPAERQTVGIPPFSGARGLQSARARRFHRLPRPQHG